MKAYLFVFLSVILAITPLRAEEDNFSGIKAAMDPATYEKSGVGKLTPQERAVLDEFIANYVARKQKVAAQVAAAEAVDKAVKEKRVQPPEVIQSRMVGTYAGYGLRTVFHLENGETWKPTNDETVKLRAVNSPNVIIVRDTFGYKMFVEGAWMVRVKRLQ